MEAFSHLGHDRHETVPLTNCDRHAEDILLISTLFVLQQNTKGRGHVRVSAGGAVRRDRLEREDRSIETKRNKHDWLVFLNIFIFKYIGNNHHY